MKDGKSHAHLSLDPKALISLDSGQAFRWKKGEDGIWRGVLGDRCWTLTEATLSSVDESSPLFSFFSMRQDWGAVTASLRGRDPYLDSALDEFPGLRILRQDHFETLVTFIVSAFNNIPRIRLIIEALCRNFGRRIPESQTADKAFDGYFSFPCPEDLDRAGECGLEACRMGFRSRYVLAAAKRVCYGDTDLNAIEKMDFDSAKRELKRIEGVGDKVASCVLLFSYSFFEAFPEDVWIKRVLNRHLNGKSSKDFGPYAGVAQQYLFMKARNEGNGGKIQE